MPCSAAPEALAHPAACLAAGWLICSTGSALAMDRGRGCMLPFFPNLLQPPSLRAGSNCKKLRAKDVGCKLFVPLLLDLLTGSK